MPARIDHAIAAAPNLEQLEAAFTRLGFHVVGGGQHPHLGTRNRIILLDQGYIELLAIADAQVVSPVVRERITTAPGWIGFALQSLDIAAEVAPMRARGADARGPRPGRLVAPDGSVRSWRTVTVGGDDLFGAAEPAPFLIQHDSGGSQHQRELAGADTILPHPNGAQRLRSVTVAVADLSAAQDAFIRNYGLATPESAVGVPALNAEALVLPLAGDDGQIVLARPQGSGVAFERLTSAGEGVCCVTVTVGDPAATRAYLEQQGIHLEQWGDGLLVPGEETGGAPLMFMDDSA